MDDLKLHPTPSTRGGWTLEVLGSPRSTSLGSELDRSEPNCIELGAIQNRVETCRTDPVPIHFGHTSCAAPVGVVLPCSALVAAAHTELGKSSTRHIGLVTSTSTSVSHSNGRTIDRVTELISKGKLRPVIQHRYPLKDVALAFTESAGGHVGGKLLIDVPYPAGVECGGPFPADGASEPLLEAVEC